jgi:ADP-heptose:LPS heptosyltransferase
MANIWSPKKIAKSLSIRDFHRQRNKVLILREVGGLGDILMHRMMFEDFKLLMPDLEVVFACPAQYHDAVKGHPYIDTIVASKDTDIHDYIISYNTTSACTRYEMRLAPFSKNHRSDIWANHCGVALTKHNMHISLSQETIDYGKQKLKEIRQGHQGPAVLLCPISAMAVKNLNEVQLKGTVERLRKMGFFVYSLHTAHIVELAKLGVPVVTGQSIPKWMGVINAADYVISVDTSTFHFAGGIGKPLTGIFTFADGKVYGKHYKFALVQKHRDNGDWDCGPCYNWCNCTKSNKIPKPCLTEITVDMIMDGFNDMVKMWPVEV